MTARLRPLREEEAAEAAVRAQAAFGATDEPELVDRIRRRIAAGTMHAYEDGDGTVVAQVLLTTVDHWFGGRRVACQHVAGVAVPPEHRGRGVARGLLTAALNRAAADGVGLSLLFPATTRLYRGLGYEHAGHYARYRLEARRAPAAGPVMRAGEIADAGAIEACAAVVASRRNGPEVRDAARWQQLHAATFSYVLDGDEPGTAEAYALVQHRTEPGDWQYVLELVDWGATTPRGLEAVVGFVGRHGTIGKAAEYRDAVPAETAHLVGEQDVELRSNFLWMARGIDLPAAVAGRGFSPAVRTRMTLRVDDAHLAGPRGPWELVVDRGRGRLEKVPADTDAEVVLDARAIGPLYTGFRSAQSLALAGLAAGSPSALGELTAAFAGAPPLLTDFF